jgi:hypothetical protein
LPKTIKQQGGLAVIVRSLLYYIAFPIILWGNSKSIYGQEGYPIPPKTDKLLFYFQRSHNKNTVVYDLNTNAEGKLDCNKPVHAYWIRYEEGGTIKELSFIQQKAFGLHWQLSNKEKESFTMHFNSFKKRTIHLMRAANGIYKAFITINNEYAELTAMFIKSENNSLGFPLKIKYVDLKGIDIKNRQIITERIIP